MYKYRVICRNLFIYLRCNSLHLFIILYLGIIGKPLIHIHSIIKIILSCNHQIVRKVIIIKILITESGASGDSGKGGSGL